MLPVDAERVGLGFRRFWGAASGNVVFSIGEADTEGAIVRITQVQADRSAIAVVPNLRCARIRVAIAGEATHRIDPHAVAANGCCGLERFREGGILRDSLHRSLDFRRYNLFATTHPPTQQ